ncbi:MULTISPECIES: LysR family transcriptional regulator [Paraburkholderia]|uniref:LysR family transcriptional regulator n=1 Tax=Paraburkholderia TaxID=1822464 RepID=UPI002AB66170|nr:MULTISPECIES: LysR family transcriptional regulator [Paraburkholderia]
MIQLIHLRCFTMVAAELHFGRAALRLNMTQPPLTRNIQLLERELGVSLFERDRRSVKLTASGKAFLPEAEDILRRVQHAQLTARRARGGETGSVTLGFLAVAAFSVLPKVVSVVREEFPGIELELKEMTTLDQIDAINAGRLDLCLIRPLTMSPPGLESVCLLRERFVLAMPSDHPLTQERRLTLRSVDGEALVMYSPSDGRYSYELLAGLFRAASVTPRYVQYVANTHTMLSLVSGGTGIALVPESARRLKFENVVFRALPIEPPVHAELFLVWRSSNPNKASELLQKKLIEELLGSSVDKG